MIMAKPAHTMPRMRAEKLRGAPASRGLSAPGRREGAEWDAARARLTFPDTRVEQDAPGEPHGRRQGQRVFLLLFTVHLEPAEGAAGRRARAGEDGRGSPAPPPRPAPPRPRRRRCPAGPRAALT